MSFGLNETTIQRMHDVLAKYPAVEQAIIYGSRAMGNYREGSDIDITLIGKVSDTVRSRIWLDLDDLNMPYLIDLSVFQELKSESLIGHIQRVGKLFYERSKRNVGEQS